MIKAFTPYLKCRCKGKCLAHIFVFYSYFIWKKKRFLKAIGHTKNLN